MSAWKPSLGATCVGWATVFRVWAPDAGQVDLQLQPQHSGAVTIPMVRSPDGYFHETVSGARPGDVYSYTVDGRGPFPDPASRFQPQGVHGPSEIIDPSHFPWSDQAWRGTPRERLVLYELHVGTFTPEGSFASAAERLPYLKELGVTAVELMPLADFPGSRNWGYDGVAWFAPARCYGRPEDLRSFVNQAHQLGLGVFLDVVYNHFGPDGAYHSQFSKSYCSLTHHNPWGARINFDGPGSEWVRDFVIANALHWVHEYHLDGLRLDATHAIVDESPRPIIADVAASVHHSLGSPGRLVHVVAEDVRNLAHMLQPERDGGWDLDGVWSDDFHHQVRRALTGDSEAYFQDFDGSAASIAATARKGWFYCGQFAPYFNEPRGTDPVGLPLSRFVFFIQNHDQIGNRALGDRLHHSIHPAAYRAATALLLLLPETPLLFMGQEWAASTPFLYFTHHQPELGKLVTQGRRNEFIGFAAFADPSSRKHIPDPQAPETFDASRLRWHEAKSEPHASTLRLYRDLLQLRRDHLTGGDVFEIAAANDAILTLHQGPVSALVCLHDPGQAPLPARAVRLVLSTEDPQYAADGAPPEVDLEKRSVRFQRPGAVIFDSHSAGPGLETDRSDA